MDTFLLFPPQHLRMSENDDVRSGVQFGDELGVQLGDASGLTSQHTQPGGGRDLPCRVGGVTFVNGFVSGGPQRLDPQD